MAERIKRLNKRSPSKVETTLRSLKVGDKIPVIGSISYWRNRQALLHKENASLWIRVYVDETGPVADRLA
ncbi:hypothetical protein [Pedobacter cryoconitis]|uniref:Uncharacterized protein n=1 Tax=Pedobacter cryoconitis TaxID=188932 RepID=A0A327S8I0_9SPHI|nr:hypothetical protein [Pedobacter cryoconitis]RAJ24294.1 hypothetical protein LY11_04467 [Pedobacter cryoconitis]